MKLLKTQRLMAIGLAITLCLLLLLSSAPRLQAADHGDAPMTDEDRSADLDDVYAFVDPNDNSKLDILFTVYGFIVPSEAPGFSTFDPRVRFLIGLETTGDARLDQFIDIRFSPRTSETSPQTATVILPFGETFTAPTTMPTFADTPNPFTVTTDAATGVSFFAGETDDPFFFDLTAFKRFVNSVLAGAPNPTLLQRGRDSFAGYNVQAVALSIPTSYLRLQRTGGNPNGNSIGVSVSTERQRRTVINRDGSTSSAGGFAQVDREGNPAVNVALIPFSRKDEYNSATPLDDARGRFAADIIATLKALGTNNANIAILAGVAVTNGDILRLNLSTPNSGPGGGNNAGAGFPNGRRLGDDVIDTILFFINNQSPLGDNVNGNDVPLTNTFPYFAPPQQPRAPGVIDDNTRN